MTKKQKCENKYHKIPILSGLIFLLAGFFCLASSVRAEGYFSFDETTKILTISTQMLDLKIEGGAVVYIKDKATGEVLTDTNSMTNRANDTMRFLAFTSNGPNGWYYRSPNNAHASFTPVNLQEGKLTYGTLYYNNSPINGTSLVFDIVVDTNGEVVVTMTGTDIAGYTPFAIDLPIMNFMKSDVILGNGRKWNRSDPDEIGNPYGSGAPQIAVAEGTSSVVAAWSEDSRGLSLQYGEAERVTLYHSTGYDHIVFNGPQDQRQTNHQVIVGGPWRIGTYSNWLNAAKRWRTTYEARTGAKPLWQNTASWVRDIHAVYTGLMWGDQARYDQLASLMPAKNLLYLLWNGDRIVLFGDHTLIPSIAIPSDVDLAAIKARGWRLMLYSPWNMYYTPAGAANQLQYYANQGYPQTGYKFTPDYAGADDPAFATKTSEQRIQDFANYWSDVDGVYYSGDIHMIHPAAPKFQDYIVRNYRNYCAVHGCDACYFDVLGVGDPFFMADRKVVNGENAGLGEKSALARINRDLPNLPVMSEYLATDLIPYVFYHWDTIERNALFNHPFRTALVGSYEWTRQQNLDWGVNDEKNSLMGALPEVALVGDYLIPDDVAIWSQAIGKLFSQDELFNDLPPAWDPQALAYYRTKYGTWIKAKKIGDTDFGYYEEIPGMGDVLRLQKSNPVIIPHPGGTVSASDLNFDTKIDLADFDILKTDFLKLAASLVNPKSDINSDGQATIRDIGIMMSQWAP